MDRFACRRSAAVAEGDYAFTRVYVNAMVYYRVLLGLRPQEHDRFWRFMLGPLESESKYSPLKIAGAHLEQRAV